MMRLLRCIVFFFQRSYATDALSPHKSRSRLSDFSSLGLQANFLVHPLSRDLSFL